MPGNIKLSGYTFVKRTAAWEGLAGQSLARPYDLLLAMATKETPSGKETRASSGPSELNTA